MGAPGEEIEAGGSLGRYRIVAEIGRGGMGVVYEAVDPELGRRVAIKVLDAGIAGATAVERFRREARLAAQLNHPGVIRVLEIGSLDRADPFLVMEFVEGGTLAAVIESGPPSVALACLEEAAAAVAHAHRQGVVHRDLKPSNILVSADGGRVKVTDFGLARHDDLTSLTRSGAFLGTLGYAAPEQAAPGRPVDARADVWALGVMLYEILAGQRPFQGEVPMQVLAAVARSRPPSLRGVVAAEHRSLVPVALRALEKDPERRHDSAAGFHAELVRCRQGRPARSLGGRFASLGRRPVLLLPLALGLVLAAAVGLTRERDRRDRRAALEDASRQAGRGELESARSAYRSLLDREPGDEQARAGLADVESRLEERAALRSREASRALSRAEAMRLVEAGLPALGAATEYRRRRGADREELTRLVETARESFVEAIGLAPEMAAGHYLLGRAWELLGFDDRAESCWRRAIEVDPEHGPARFRLGRLLLGRSFLVFVPLDLGDAEDVAETRASAQRLAREGGAQIERALAAGEGLGEEVEARIARAMVAMSLGYHEQALDVARRAIEELEEDAEGIEWLHWIVAQELAGDERLAAYGRALEACPTFELALYCRGTFHIRHGGVDEAIRDLEAVLEVRPSFEGALLNLGSAHLMRGDHAVALDCFSRALERDPDDPTARSNRGAARHLTGDFAGALLDFDRAIELQPHWAAHHLGRSHVRAALGDRQGALDDIERAIELRPDHGEAYAARGVARKSMGDLAGALADYDRAIELGPTASHHFNRGLARRVLGQEHRRRGEAGLATGHLRAAFSDFDRAIELDPTFASAYLGRGNVRVDFGDHARAIDDYGLALEADPNMILAHRNRGLSRKRLGDLEGAVADLRRAIELAPPDWPFRAHAEERLAEALEGR